MAEYAVLLALVVGLAIVGSRFLGESARGAFSSLVASTSGAAPVPVDAAEVHAASAPPTASPASGLFSLRLLLAEAIAVAALAGLWFVLHLARKRQELVGEDEVPAAVRRAIPHNRLYQKRQQIYRILGNDMRALFASRIQVRHVMSTRVIRVSSQTSADEVRKKMKAKQFRHLLVCHDDDRLLGIISDRDLAERQGASAGALMTKNPLTVSPSMLLNPAVTLMIENRISCLPVVDPEGDLVGVLTSTDLMMTLQCALQLLHKVAMEVGGPHAPAPLDASADVADYPLQGVPEEELERELAAMT